MAGPSSRQSKNVYLDTNSNHQRKLLTQQFAEITMDEVRAHAQLYQDRGTRDTQNAEMLIQCLKASITRSVYNKVYLQMDKYTTYKEGHL